MYQVTKMSLRIRKPGYPIEEEAFKHDCASALGLPKATLIIYLMRNNMR